MEATVPVNCFLDAPINTTKGIRSTQCRKLEENGFHTVRKLLQYFPCTYVNMQPVEGQAEEISHGGKAQLKKSMVGSSYLMSLVRSHTYWIYACHVGIEEHILQA